MSTEKVTTAFLPDLRESTSVLEAGLPSASLTQASSTSLRWPLPDLLAGRESPLDSPPPRSKLLQAGGGVEHH